MKWMKENKKERRNFECLQQEKFAYEPKLSYNASYLRTNTTQKNHAHHIDSLH